MLNSLEIAGITGKLHKHVRRDIRNLEAQSVLIKGEKTDNWVQSGPVKISMVFSNGKNVEVYELNDYQVEKLKYGSYILAGLRLEELEKDVDEIRAQNVLLKVQIDESRAQYGLSLKKNEELSDRVKSLEKRLDKQEKKSNKTEKKFDWLEKTRKEMDAMLDK